MGQNQPKVDIYDIAKHLWDSADELSSNSGLKESEYSTPLLGLIFLRFADSRFSQSENELVGSGPGRRQITGHSVSTRELESGEGEEPKHLVLTAVPCQVDEDETFFGPGMDIAAQRKLSTALEESERELRAQAQALADSNTALRVVLEQADRGRRELESTITENLDVLVAPLLERLGRSLRNRPEAVQVAALRETLDEIVRPLRHQLVGELEVSERLTPRETEVLNLIRRGLSTKRIAEALYLSDRTVAFHRANIRRKLGLTGVKERLVTYLGPSRAQGSEARSEAIVE